MRIYARPGWRMARQLTADAFVLVWVIGWGLVGRAVNGLVDQLAVPARKSADTARELSDAMTSAQNQVGQLPMVGDQLSDPFGRLSAGLSDMVGQANEQAAMIHHAAQVAGWLTFAIPVLAVLVLWLPPRIRFVRQAAAARDFIDADADLELFALRAMANLPMARLARVSDDPVGAWRRGDRDLIRQLAALELERTGLAMPAPVRPLGDTRPR